MTHDAQTAAQFLTFSLGEEVFGMDIRTVREIIQVGPMTTVPLMPSFVRGIINLRGAVVPVIDLHRALRAHTGAGDEEDLHRHLRRPTRQRACRARAAGGRRERGDRHRQP